MIKYVPYVGDSKRAMDEYTSEIMMGGKLYICILLSFKISICKETFNVIDVILLRL